MPEYLEQTHMDAWLAHHGIDPGDVREIRITPTEYQNGCMRLEMLVRDDRGKPMVGNNEVVIEERVVRLQALPGQEVVWDA